MSGTQAPQPVRPWSLSEVLCREHALGPAQDGVLGCVIGMLFRRDLQDGWDRLHVGVNGMTDHLGDELINQDDSDVVASQKAPAERKRSHFISHNKLDGRIVSH